MHAQTISRNNNKTQFTCMKTTDVDGFATFSVPSVGIFLGGDRDELLGSFGDVVGALDDLLGDQLHVRARAALRRRCLPALALKPTGAGGQQTQRSSYCV